MPEKKRVETKSEVRQDLKDIKPLLLPLSVEVALNKERYDVVKIVFLFSSP